MPSRSKSLFFGDFVFHILEDVYEPAEDTFLIADNFEVRTDDYILDLGTGCGILGVLSASNGANVTATDLNPSAVRCAKENARSNQLLTKMHFIRGDLFKPIRKKQTFDVILFNPPYLPAEPKEHGSWLDAAWIGGASGRKIIDRFIREAPGHLKRDGSIFMIQSSLSGIEKTISMFKKVKMETVIITKQDCPFFETLALLRAKHLTR